MKEKIVNLYEYDELGERAKEAAREWLRGLTFTDNNDWDHVFEDAVEIGRILGIDIATHSVELMGGKTRQAPTIYFSGFSSQGDGACFEGDYAYAKGSVKAIKDYAPQDTELHRIAQELFEIQKRHQYGLTARIRVSGRHSHSGTMSVEVDHTSSAGNYVAVTPDTDSELTQLMRDFADWIYKSLETEHRYQTSDEAIEEAIRANEYTFTENGERED